MQYYIISYFLKKFTFINTEVEIAIKWAKKNAEQRCSAENKIKKTMCRTKERRQQNGC